MTLNPDDARLVKHIQQVTQGSAKLLVTLARRGKCIQQERSRRAESLLAAVGSHPLYKGGRLAFDMLEIEDIILDASTIVPMSTEELTQILATSPTQLVETLRRMGSVDQQSRMPSGDNDSVGVLPSSANSGDGSGTVARLPRLVLGPTESGGTTTYAFAAGEEGARVGDVYPKLQSSDYLYDYVVLGLLDILSSTATLQIDNF